jgi:hypothetical protein
VALCYVHKIWSRRRNAHCNCNFITSRDGKTCSQIDHILVGRRWLSSKLDIRCFRGADCDTYRCLVVTEVRDRQLLSKWEAENCGLKRFNLKKLNRVEVGNSNKLKSQTDLQHWRT